MKNIIQHLENLVKTWEAYENPLEPAQYDEAIQTISKLQATLRSLQPGTSLLSLIMENRFTGRDISTDTQLMVQIPYTLVQADETRLLLASYQPYCQSQTRHHLQERQKIVAQFQRLVSTVSTINVVSTIQVNMEEGHKR